MRLGLRIRLARLRRRLRQADLAAKIGRTRATVIAIERGSSGTEIGAYVSALWALGLLQELELVADQAWIVTARRFLFRCLISECACASH